MRIFLVLNQLTIHRFGINKAKPSFNAHQGIITASSWQPIQFPAALGDDTERLLVAQLVKMVPSVSGMLGRRNQVAVLNDNGSGVVALAFTPDGVFISGATNQGVLIWKVDDVNFRVLAGLVGTEWVGNAAVSRFIGRGGSILLMLGCAWSQTCLRGQ